MYTYARAHAGIIQSLCMSPLVFHNTGATRRMLSCSTDRTVKMWNADPVPDGHGEFAEYHEDDSGSDDDDEVSGARDAALFRVRPEAVAASEPLTVYQGRSAFNSLSHHAHQPRFASASNTVQIWDMNRGGGSDAILSMHMGVDAVQVVRYNQSETDVLASAGTDRGVTLYDVRSGKPLHKVVLSVRGAAHTRCGRTTSRGRRWSRRRWRWRARTTICIPLSTSCAIYASMRNLSSATQIYKGHVGAVMSVDWSPTGQNLATASYDRTVRLWDTGKGARSRDVYHTKRMQKVFCVSYTLDARFVVSGSDDGNVRLWKHHASDKLGIVNARERASREYAQALRSRWSSVGDVAKIERQRHVPKQIRAAQKLQHTMTEARRVKEERRRKHTKVRSFYLQQSGTKKPKAARKQVVLEEKE